MAETKTSYSNSQGIRLLELAVEQFGPIFTMDQIAAKSDLRSWSPQQLRKLVSKLSQSGWIEIIKRGTYVVTSPLYSGNIPAYAIANALVQPMAISFWTALAHHGFTTQNPTVIQAVTPIKVVTPEMRMGEAYHPRGRACWRTFNLEIEFIYTQPNRFWGFQKEWVNSWTQVAVTDRERTVLDVLIHPELFGGIRPAGELLEEALPQIDIPRLVEYALRYDVGAVIKRLGWFLARMGIEQARLELLRKYPVTGIIRLDSSHPRVGSVDPVWLIDENMEGV
jgi:predicted transcriptional regulator of viral defense system